MEPFTVEFVDRVEAVVDAWRKWCGDLPGVTIRCGSILETSCYAIVSPANSFGFMDGGLDRAYSEYFGWQVQERLQERIRTYHHGELLVGQAERVETDHQRIPYVIAAPTMRVPMVLGSETVHPYLATRAALLCTAHAYFVDSRGRRLEGRPFPSVAFPGMGTGVGQVPPDTCARQMRTAFQEVCLGRSSFPITWHDAQTRHQLLYANAANVRDLQRG